MILAIIAVEARPMAEDEGWFEWSKQTEIKIMKPKRMEKKENRSRAKQKESGGEEGSYR